MHYDHQGARSHFKVVAVDDELIVKFGGGIETWESQALLYLEREVPDVPAPRSYAMYQDAEETFLIMQRIAGVTLDTIWTSLGEAGKSGRSIKPTFQTPSAI